MKIRKKLFPVKIQRDLSTSIITVKSLLICRRYVNCRNLFASNEKCKDVKQSGCASLSPSSCCQTRQGENKKQLRILEVS